MTAAKSKAKNGHPGFPVTLANLKSRCKARGLTITGLADRINSPRNMIYLAVETPTRYSGTYARIIDALTK